MHATPVRILLFCLLPLLAGGCIYVFFREGGLLGYSIPLSHPQRFHTLIGVLPDFLWSFSLANALFIYAASFHMRFSAWRWVVLILLLSQELVQLGFPHYFRFDPWDLAASVCAFLLSLWVYERQLHQINAHE